MAEFKAPGVYIVEEDAFPQTVVQVPTDEPAFVGYTEQAKDGAKSLTGIPTRITSLAEYEALFGGGPTPAYTFTEGTDGSPSLSPVQATRFNLYNSLRLFFDNGGSSCWIVSTGSYTTGNAPTPKNPDDFGNPIWEALEQLPEPTMPEPTMIVIPDAVLMATPADYKAIWDKAFPHCIKMQSRVAILDVYDGDQPRTHDDADVISGTRGFRNLINHADLSFGAAYYPWLNTNLTSSADASYTNITAASRPALGAYIMAEFADAPDETRKAIAALITTMTKRDTPEPTIRTTHQTLAAKSPRYKATITALLNAMNRMPPSAAMAGIYARTDASFGVWKSPANTPVNSAMSPCVSIDDAAQQDLNLPPNGKAINAIRSFPGRGILVWGARTLDGNANDWRYIPVRRTAIMLEQSIKTAIQAYAFSPNTAATWTLVKATIEAFLTTQWKSGALVGSSPRDAYSVDVGLGSTMSPNDLLEGTLRVTVAVALIRPAEFIHMTFQQEMQPS